MFWEAVAVIDGGEVRARTTPADIMAWEAESGKSMPEEGTTYTVLFAVSYQALRRTGATDLEFDEFSLAVVDFNTEVIDVGPTKRARSGKRSPA